MDYERFITTVQEEAGVARDDAERAAQATLATLAERLSGGEARDLAKQLPEELRQHLLSGGPKAEPFDVAEFFRRVAAREGVAEPFAELHARAVFAALTRAVSADELRDMTSELSKDFRDVLDAVIVPLEPRAISAEEFVRRVSDRTGLDRDRARRATEAVLEVLAERISGGEVDDLAVWLPNELRGALERGNARTHGAARRLSLAEFVSRVAELEGVDPDQATPHVRAVLATLREAVGRKEFGDVAAQLPREYAPLLALA
jgi:uncharacterized protein (DUF2267 family)